MHYKAIHPMTKNMGQSLAILLLIAVLMAAVCNAGCTTSTSQNVPAVPSTAAGPGVVKVPAVSINSTPVKFAQVNGVSLGYREFGAGEPLLMITGFGATMHDWNQTFIGILASKYQVYIYDHRGMGNSSDNNVIPTMSQYADDAAGLMTALGYDSMHVYGVSLGSSISQQLVIDHPERVRKLVLDSNVYSIRIPETKKLLMIIEDVNANASLSRGLRNEAQADLAWNGSWDSLSGIHKDVMLVAGTADDLTPDAISARMAGQINGSWLVRFKGLPHVGSDYAPVEYGENALAFLGTNESAPWSA
jgi:pimeloyl-ACP methyl ester carboxylesterase